MFLRIAAFSAALTACALAHSAVLYQTGFETPTYNAGALGTQGGWSALAEATIQRTANSDQWQGFQRLRINSAGLPASAQRLTSRSVPYSSAGNPLSVLRTVAFFQVGGGGASPRSWTALAVGSDKGFICQLVFNSSSQFGLGLQNSSGGVLQVSTREFLYQVQVDVNFSTNTCTGYVDGKYVGSGPVANVANVTTIFISIGLNSLSGTGPEVAELDEIAVSAINPSTQVIEFYNTPLDHFFITANAAEANAIDSGSAGPGWRRTGNTFEVGGNVPVCRFYGSQSPGPNSHFYTADAAECQGLKSLQATTPATQKRWNFESNDFITTAAVQGACPAGLTPVYRMYNKGNTRNVDSNHRITANGWMTVISGEAGWAYEGVVMCAK